MVVPGDEPISAFAVYSNIDGKLTRAQRKRRKYQEKKAKAVQALSKKDKLEIVRAKKAKKVMIMKKNLNKEPKSISAIIDSQRNEHRAQTEKKKMSLKANKVLSSEQVKLKKKLKVKKRKQTQPTNDHSSQHEGSSNDERDLSITSQMDLIRAERVSNEPMSKGRQSGGNSMKPPPPPAGELLGETALQTLLSSVRLGDFMRDYWEKTPLHIPNRDSPSKYSKLMSTKMMDELLRSQLILFGRDLDVTSYIDGVKENHNVDGLRAQAHIVWDYYKNGCSVRLLHPHTCSKHLFILNSALQEYFGCFVGANTYLTPPSSQGFAPHYDDIEAFVVQLEGQKNWKVYKPRNKYEVLPRFSSGNFSEDDLEESPLLEITLNPGDVLYIPRGFIHQASTVENVHSLHVTISVYQKTSWFDLMEKMVPLALNRAVQEDVEFRKGMPIGYLRSAGFAYGSSHQRTALIHKCKNLFAKLINYIDIDGAVDMMGVNYMHDALPPALSKEEAICSVFGNGWRMNANGNLSNRIKFTLSTRVRFTRANCYRLVQEDVKNDDGEMETQVRLYHTIDNSKEYHGESPSFLLISPEYIAAIRILVHDYPQFTSVSSLPCASDDEKIFLVVDLWDQGVVVTDSPFEAREHESSVEPESDQSMDEIEEEEEENEDDVELCSEVENDDEEDDESSSEGD